MIELTTPHLIWLLVAQLCMIHCLTGIMRWATGGGPTNERNALAREVDTLTAVRDKNVRTIAKLRDRCIELEARLRDVGKTVPEEREDDFEETYVPRYAFEDAVQDLGRVADLIHEGDYREALNEAERALDRLEGNNTDLPYQYAFPDPEAATG